jgi:hypothetical protein
VVVEVEEVLTVLTLLPDLEVEEEVQVVLQLYYILLQK